MGASAILSDIDLDKKSGWGKNRARKINSVCWQNTVAFTVLSSFWREARDLRMKSFCAFNTVAKLQGFLIV